MTNKDIIHDIEAAVEKVAHSAVNIISDAAQIIVGATHSTIEKLHSTHNQLKHLLEEKGISCASEEIIKGRELPTIVAAIGGEHVSEGHNPAISKHLLNRVIFSRKNGEEDLSNAMNLQLEIENIKLVALPGSRPASISDAKPL